MKHIKLILSMMGVGLILAACSPFSHRHHYPKLMTRPTRKMVNGFTLPPPVSVVEESALAVVQHWEV
jgi:hypothetical protein